MSGQRILVIDDSPTILKLVQLVLTKADYRVAIAPSGKAGLAAAREDRPDLLLLDWMMPGMDGQAVLAELAADPALAAIEVVLMTARGEELKSSARRAGNVIDVIAKPFKPESLLAVVAHRLDARKASDGAAVAAAADIGSLSLLPEGAPQAEASTFPANAALAGDLAVISIADVFSLLRDEAHSGLLSITSKEARLRISLGRGRIDFATAEGVPEEFLLGRFLVRSGALTKADLDRALERRRRAPGAAPGLFGAALVSAGVLNAAALRKAVALQTAALVFESLRWGAGRFWFESTETQSEAAREAALALEVDALLMEGFRRVDEWQLIEREVGDFDRLFVRDEEKVAAFGPERLTREEATVLELLNGKNSVRDIVQISQLGSFEASKMVYRLLRTKLIRRRVAPVAT